MQRQCICICIQNWKGAGIGEQVSIYLALLLHKGTGQYMKKLIKLSFIEHTKFIF